MNDAQNYAAHGMALVPIPLGKKGPVVVGWNEASRVIKDVAVAATMTGNMGLAHAYSTPRTATIDVDDLELAIPLLANHGIDLAGLMNASDSVLILSGRPNRTKLLFRLPEDLPTFASKVLKVKRKTVVEFRCASVTGKTVQDVLPPSIHPDTGRPYQWGGNGTWTALQPLPMTIAALWGKLSKTNPPGRKDALTGLGPVPAHLRNNGQPLATILASDTLPETPENIARVKAWLAAILADCRHELWLNILFALNDLLWDCGEELARTWSQSAPGRFNESVFFRTWHSSKPGGGITWRSLPFYAGQSADAHTPDQSTIAGASTNPAAPTWLVELNTRYAEVRVGSKVLILDQRTPIETPTVVRYGNHYLEVAAFKQMLNGRFAPAPNDTSRPMALAVAWLSNPQRRQYQGVTFAPGTTTPPDIFNLWTGFGVESAAGDIALWLRVLDAVVKEPTTRSYALNWLAQKIQFPGSVPGTILLVRGDKGTGKNSLFEPVVRLFGSHGRVFDDAEQIAGRFTGHLQTVAFAVLDEALFTGNSQQADRIKSRVTATSTTFEAKGRDPIQGVNRCAYVSLSNHEHVWQATGDERRAVVIEASNDLINDRTFWSQYHAWLNGPGPGALLHHLQRIDLQGFDPRVIPKDKALRHQIEQTALRDAATAWWFNILSEGGFTLRDFGRITLSATGTTEISKSDLHQSFKDATNRPR